MTAFELIDSIFWRAQPGTPGNLRRITREQLNYLRDLIDKAGPSEAIKRGAPGSLIWTPAGRHKYVVTEDLTGNRHTLTRLANVASESGTLF